MASEKKIHNIKKTDIHKKGKKRTYYLGTKTKRGEENEDSYF